MHERDGASDKTEALETIWQRLFVKIIENSFSADLGFSSKYKSEEKNIMQRIFWVEVGKGSERTLIDLG